jgi:hypothetical protein
MVFKEQQKVMSGKQGLWGRNDPMKSGAGRGCGLMVNNVQPTAPRGSALPSLQDYNPFYPHPWHGRPRPCFGDRHPRCHRDMGWRPMLLAVTQDVPHTRRYYACLKASANPVLPGRPDCREGRDSTARSLTSPSPALSSTHGRKSKFPSAV